MKTILTLILFVACTFSVFSQNQKPSLKITGKVKEIAMQERSPSSESATYLTYIKLELKLKNTSSVPVIFLQQNPNLFYAEVFPEVKKMGVFLVKTSGATSSFVLSENDWAKLKESLDKQTPPKNKTRILKPDEEIEFDGFVRFDIPRFATGNANQFPVYSNTLDFIKENAPTQIETTFDTWSTLSLLKGSTEKRKAEFADKLRNKWEKIGYLWTEKIEAEPISIDFDSVIFKTLID